MKKVAIIGGGLAGLATAYYLLKSQKVSVTVFEKEHIGAGASGVCSGLLHPYPGISARRSSLAHEGLSHTKVLLRLAERHTPQIVASETGILRQSLNPEQKSRLIEHSAKWKDVEQVDDNLFCIHSGITVHTHNYLKGLEIALIQMGLEVIIRSIQSLEELSHYDHIVIAAGYGIKAFPECASLKVKFLKGQALTLEGDYPYEKSFISKGYMAHFGHKTFEVGSTYEREFLDDLPDKAQAEALLQDKLARCPHAQVIDCRAGVRVAALGQYLPLAQQVSDKAHVFTALGSRGLLYHALYAKALVHEIL